MKRHKQISFDIDTNVAKKILGESSYTNIYSYINKFMEKRSWKHIEGSVYMSEKPLENVDIQFLIKALKKQYPYITKCIKAVHQADISKIHSLNKYFDYDGTPGRFAKQQQEVKREKARFD